MNFVRSLRRPLVAAAALVASLALADRASAQTFAPIYGIRHTKPPEIWKIDLATGQATFVSSNMKQTKVACARHPRTGQIWLFSNVTPNKISVWDPATDAETTIHSGPNIQFHRVGFDADCHLYGVPLNSNVLYSIDTTTGACTNLGGMKNVDPAGDGGDLCFAPGRVDQFLYFAAKRLYLIDVATLGSTVIKDDVGFKTTGAAFTADGRMWVSSDTDFYSCDPATGDVTLVGSFGMRQILDLTEDLSPLYFGIDNLAPQPNETVTASLHVGKANGALELALVDVDGTPTFVDYGIYSFDAAGEWSISDDVPPGLSGTTATFQCWGFAPNGKLLATNTQTIAFQ